MSAVCRRMSENVGGVSGAIWDKKMVLREARSTKEAESKLRGARRSQKELRKAREQLRRASLESLVSEISVRLRPSGRFKNALGSSLTRKKHKFPAIR